MEIYEGCGNVYADMDAADADEMFMNAQLTVEIATIIRARNWPLDLAAQATRLTASKLSALLKGEFRDVSAARLQRCLAALRCSDAQGSSTQHIRKRRRRFRT